MTTEALELLLESIEHWQRLATGMMKEGEDVSANECPLCRKYMLEYYNQTRCDGCPVMEKTGSQFCRGTPYYPARDAHDSWGIKSKQFKRAAQKELAFLLSLLPKERQPRLTKTRSSP